MRWPQPLKRGDTVAILSPASVVRREYVEGARRFLESQGYAVRLMPHVSGPACGSFAAGRADRLADFKEALAAPEVKAILCARGGYGCVHLLEELQPTVEAGVPKWVIGFSDVSALHALMHRNGIVSIHSPMAKHLTEMPADDGCTSMLLRLLRGDRDMTVTAPVSPYNRCGKAAGELRGGNLAVLNGLAGTPFDMLHIAPGEEVILFVEDIGEKIYAVERMMYRLRLSGDLSRVSGLIIGQFTDYKSDSNFAGMEEMIDKVLTDAGVECPVAFGFPVGHVDTNYPLVEGARAILEVNESGTVLRYESCSAKSEPCECACGR